MSADSSEKKALWPKMMLLGFILFLIGFFAVCGILGVNAKRSERAQQFLNELVSHSYTLPYTLLSQSMKETFYENVDIFTLSAKAFINKIRELNSLKEDEFPRRFLARSSFVFSVKEGTKIQVNVTMVPTDRPQIDVMKDIFVFYVSPSRSAPLEKVSVSMVLEGGMWRVDSCTFKNLTLDVLDEENIHNFASSLKDEELLTLGNIFFDKKLNDKAMIFYGYYYERLIKWNPEAIRALERLKIFWTETNNTQLDKLTELLSEQPLPRRGKSM